MENRVTFNGDVPHYQLSLPLQFGQELTELPPDDISYTIHQAIIGSGLLKELDLDKRNHHGFPPLSMLTSIFLSFAEWGYASTRRMEHDCRFDKRFIFLFNGKKPSHMTFARFIKDYLPDDRLEKCFIRLNEYIAEAAGINQDDLYVDGTKIEADATKFSFVWKKAVVKYLACQQKKAHDQIVHLNKYLVEHPYAKPVSILHELSARFLFQAREIAAQILNDQGILFTYGKGKRKHPLQRVYDNLSEIIPKVKQYEDYLELLGDRNSMSKTDTDACMLHLKYDYYCHTGVFKPAYNVQIGVCDGFIWNVYVSTDANDLHTYIPFMDQYHENYDRYPENVCADAGYGSYDNYIYNASKNINSYIKDPYWRKMGSNSKKDKYKPWKFQTNEKGNLVCPEGHELELIGNRRDYRSEKEYPKYVNTYGTDKCKTCPAAKQCTRSKSGLKKVSRTVGLDELLTDARGKLASEKGIEMRKQRCIQAEGVFGQIKEDYRYSRFRRRGFPNVRTEFFLVAITFNLRKLHRLLTGEPDEPNLAA